MPHAELPGVEQLTGRDDGHVIDVVGQPGHRLHPRVVEAWLELRGAAWEEGIDLRIASSHRGFERQLEIWNDKVSGRRPAFDLNGDPLDMTALDERQRVLALLTWSALPGCSRHHWGTDLDVYDAGVIPRDYVLQLSHAEYRSGGLFERLVDWLDNRPVAGSHGFFRPYDGSNAVAAEPWHLSWAPLADACQARLNRRILRSVVDETRPLMHATIDALFGYIFDNYITIQRPGEG